MLEFYLTKKWISDLGARLMAALPVHHAAMRCVSLSSVALRVFSLDRSILYDRVVEEPRSRRSAVPTAAPVSSSGRERRAPLGRGSSPVNVAPPKRVGRPRKRKVDDYEDDTDGINAAIAARLVTQEDVFSCMLYISV